MRWARRGCTGLAVLAALVCAPAAQAGWASLGPLAPSGFESATQPAVAANRAGVEIRVWRRAPGSGVGPQIELSVWPTSLFSNNRSGRLQSMAEGAVDDPAVAATMDAAAI